MLLDCYNGILAFPGLRTKPESLSIRGRILRGTSWRTKTSVSGQPWGVCCLGFTTRPSTGHWVFRFLEALQLGIDKRRENWGTSWTPAFLLPSWTDSVPCSTPCSYHHALPLIRFYSQFGWLSPALLSPEQAANRSTHSMKSTLLAAAGQTQHEPGESRQTRTSQKVRSTLYSRDDVWPSLFLQRDILVDVSTGWRPLTSQARGAKQPLPEPFFCSPVITQDDLNMVQMLYRQKQLHRLKPANHRLTRRLSLTTLMNKVKTPLLPRHLLFQANHRKMKFPFELHQPSG